MSQPIDPIIKLFPKNSRSWEIFLWFNFSALFSGKFWIFLITERNFNIKFLPEYYTSILMGIITLLMPLLFWLINGKLPLESLRSRAKKKPKGMDYNIQSRKDIHIYTDQSAEHEETEQKTATSILESFASESTALSNSLFNRSGIYLFIGTLIAVVGVLFFSFQSITVIEKESIDLSTVILLLAPKTGILIFIELIAFFFLKQYRSAMDEHRYFESIKRERQRAYVITLLLHQEDTRISIEKYIEACGFNRECGKLKTGETTEIIESKKLDSEEIKLVENILATIRKSANK